MNVDSCALRTSDQALKRALQARSNECEIFSMKSLPNPADLRIIRVLASGNAAMKWPSSSVGRAGD
ncbi:hypothetical protein [Stenotrophomonas sp. VV52]|uniref:hypothetical protein n=1 Tax=Stenotrophomonas TaxID=40323 RepID=UPI0011AEE912|nr:hypothetical protein [Stenotrophomonas sp. VV52]